MQSIVRTSKVQATEDLGSAADLTRKYEIYIWSLVSSLYSPFLQSVFIVTNS